MWLSAAGRRTSPNASDALWALDDREVALYSQVMKPVVRVLIVATLTVFAVASTVHTAGTAVMDLKMAMAAAGGMDMDRCDGCGDIGDGNVACDPVCANPLLATTSPDEALRNAGPGIYDGLSVEVVLGQTGPPDPYPPRFPILS